MWQKALTPLIKKLPDLTNKRCVTILLQSVPAPSASFPLASHVVPAVLIPSKRPWTTQTPFVPNSHLTITYLFLVTSTQTRAGPLASTAINKQGRILQQYLNGWNNKSGHLHTSSSPFSHTYMSEAHNSSSTTDHILVPEHALNKFSNCCVIEDDPMDFSDHSPVCASLQVSLPSTQPWTSQLGTSEFRPNWAKLALMSSSDTPRK